MNTTPQLTQRRKPGLWALVQLLIELVQERAWCQVSITMQAGKVEMVHISRSHKLEDLPIKDWSGQAAVAAGGSKVLAADPHS
jgi:hypothetical protein